jgi:hypothetical protein
MSRNDEHTLRGKRGISNFNWEFNGPVCLEGDQASETRALIVERW